MICFDLYCMWIEERVRLSRESDDVQTLHEQPISGTPVDVPEPSTVISMAVNRDDVQKCCKNSRFR